MDKKSVQLFKEQRLGVIKIIVFSIILAIAINMFTDGFCDVLELSDVVCTIIGFVLSLLIIFLSCIYVTNKMKLVISFDGAFIVDKTQENKLLKIPEYPISEHMYRFFYAAVKENKAIQKQWNNVMFSTPDSEEKNDERKKSFAIINELIEYCVLNNLSTFVSDYFVQQKKENSAQKLQRENIPEVLLSNRFLRLFSEQIDNRAAFDGNKMCIVAIHDDGHEEVIFMAGENGEIYECFKLYMPQGTKAKRENESIVIDTKLFVLNIVCEFRGFSTTFDRSFEKYYMGLDGEWTDYEAYKFTINLDIKYKLFSMFRRRDWKEYNWLDEYIERLQHYCEERTFLNDIDWAKQNASLRIMHNFFKTTNK